MKTRAVKHKLVKKVSVWAAKQLLTSLPVVGWIFKAIFMGKEVLKEIQTALAEDAEMLPPLAPAVAR